MTHIVMYSSGISSWAAAARVADCYGAGNTKLLFCDTKMEDDDNYRFLHESAQQLGCELIVIADGRNVFEVFKDVKYMGNSRIDPCSRILKRELADSYIVEHYEPDTATMYVGIDWTEEHRYTRMAERKLPWIYKAPLCEEPFLTKAEQLQLALDVGLKPPRMYDYGFQHANCGGFCIRSGQAQFKKLYETCPERYAAMEQQEQEVYDAIGQVKPFLRVTRDKKLHYITLKQFREVFLEGGEACDVFDWGGCGCFTEESE